MTTNYNCTRCNGEGQNYSEYAHYDAATQTFVPGNKPCRVCDGRGSFPSLDVAAIRSAIMTTRGAKQLRKSMRSPTNMTDVLACRAYYVWRMARFHGGADVTMPVMGMLSIEGDPLQKDLDALADAVAREEFGSHFRGARVWAHALGM